MLKDEGGVPDLDRIAGHQPDPGGDRFVVDQRAVLAGQVLDGPSIGFQLEPGMAFSGSGTQLVAAQSLGRICHAMELSPPFVAVALERMTEMGLEPRLAE